MRKRSSAVRRGKGARPQATREANAARPGPGKRAAAGKPPRNVNPSQDVARVARADKPAPDGSLRGKYVYCVIGRTSPQFGLAPLPARSAGSTRSTQGSCRRRSDVPIGPLDSTRENVLARTRQREVMKDHTVIPMSFGIFKTRRRLELLRSAHDAFDDVCRRCEKLDSA